MVKYEQPIEGGYAIVMKGKTPRKGTRVLVNSISNGSAWCKVGNSYMKIGVNRLSRQ